MEPLLPPVFLCPGGSSPIVEYQSEKLEEIWTRTRCDMRSEQHFWVSDMSTEGLVLKNQG